MKLVKYYMTSEKINDLNVAVNELIKKGYSYWLLEKKYGKRGVEDPKVWSQSFWNIKASAGFVYYRLRLKDAVDEIKRLSITLSSLLADLKDCYERSDFKDKEHFVEKLERYRVIIEDYLNRFVFDLKKDIEDASKNYVEDEEEFVEWIEENLKRYKDEFVKGRNRP